MFLKLPIKLLNLNLVYYKNIKHTQKVPDWICMEDQQKKVLSTVIS